MSFNSFALDVIAETERKCPPYKYASKSGFTHMRFYPEIFDKKDGYDREVNDLDKSEGTNLLASCTIGQECERVPDP